MYNIILYFSIIIKIVHNIFKIHVPRVGKYKTIRVCENSASSVFLKHKIA